MKRCPSRINRGLIACMTLMSLVACATNADTYYARGRRALAADQLNPASDAFHRAIEKDPKRGDAYFALGTIYLRQEKWSTAANALREAGRLDPSLKHEADPLLIKALYGEARHALKMGKQREAIDAFAELYERTPDFPSLREQYAAALWRYGRAKVLRGDYIEGVSALQEIMRVQPDNTEARKFLERHQFSTD